MDAYFSILMYIDEHKIYKNYDLVGINDVEIDFQQDCPHKSLIQRASLVCYYMLLSAQYVT
jgi:hypothetical protein